MRDRRGQVNAAVRVRSGQGGGRRQIQQRHVDEQHARAREVGGDERANLLSALHETLSLVESSNHEP